jgi:uncharacterized NAD(P)/FAD-binding protein YdhS
VERSGKVGRGIAFANGPARHLLNVPARSMSAFADDADHFVRWLKAQGLAGSPDDFVPRRTYGRYLSEALWDRGRHLLAAGPVHTVLDEVVDIDELERGQIRLALASGRCLVATAVVLATGVVMRGLPSPLTDITTHGRCVVNPWAEGALAPIGPASTVTLLGSGLTAVDVLLALRESGHHGQVHAISRHGLLPRAHRAEPLGDELLARLGEEVRGTKVRSLVHRARQNLEEATCEGADWRDLVDALRPVVPSLWAELNPDERLRFGRHLERLWNINRHRMAPQVAGSVEELRSSGTFHVHAGEVQSASDADGALSLQVKLPQRERPYVWATDWLVNCTGTDPQLFGKGQIVLDALLDRGFVRPGSLGWGVDTDDRGRVLDSGGRPLEWLWAIGSLRQGRLLESTSVPEIRAQARDVAADIERFLRAGPERENVVATPPRPSGVRSARLLAS